MSAAAWAAFVVVEHRGTDPMLPLALFARRWFRTGTMVGLLINLGFYPQLFVMSLLVIAACAFLAGAALVRGLDREGLTREPG